MLLAEALGEKDFLRRVKIYTTDVDEDALNHARQGSYTAKALEPVPAALREKYFTTAGSRFVFRTDWRRAIVFGRHDLVRDAPMSRLDLLTCRNTLMYFNAETQAQILNRFHFALKDTGFIILGKAELLFTHANLFTPVSVKHRVFTKVMNTALAQRQVPLLVPGKPDPPNHLVQQERMRDQAFDSGLVAHIVVDTSGALVMANQRSREVFGLSTRDVGRPLQELELSYRPADLRSLIDQAFSERRTITRRSAERTQPNGSLQVFDVQAVPLSDNGGAVLGVSVMLHDVTTTRLMDEELQRSKQEVETAYEELQSTHEELETTNEELQSTVEELETTNEELQSTNEEMETINEELQATNEQLRAMNEELQEISKDRDNANAFLQSILGGMRAGVIVVDSGFNVVHWNRKSQDLWGLEAGEVRGRSVFSLDIGLPVEQLKAQIRACMEGQAPIRDQVLSATNRRGKPIQCRVSCNVHAGPDHTARGAILLMGEIEKG
jgi:two-component system CheB/CheR fusion protein